MDYRSEDDGNRLMIRYTGQDLTQEQYDEAYDSIPDMTNVIYDVVVNGQTIKSVTVSQEVGTVISPETAPDAIKNDFITLSNPTKSVVSHDGDGHVAFTGTYSADLPIEFSTDYASATWYQMKPNREENANALVAYNPRKVSTDDGHGYYFVTKDVDKVYDNSQWAFVGSPYSFHIINRGAGENMELHGCANGRPLIENKDSMNGRPDSNADNVWKTWTIGRNTANGGQAWIGSIGVNNNVRYYLNDRDATLGTYNNNDAKTDKGSALSFTEVTDAIYSGTLFDTNVDDDYISSLKWGQKRPEEIKKGQEDAFAAARTAYKANPNRDTYRAVISNLVYTFGLDAYKGSDGFVNISNAATAGDAQSIALKSDDPANFAHAQTTDTNDNNQLWVVTSPSENKVNLFNVNAQKYLGVNVGNDSTVALSTEPVDWTITWGDNNTFTLANKAGNLNIDVTDGNQGNLNAGTGNDTWQATTVKSLSIAAHTSGNNSYATVCYPFAVTLDKGNAYTAALNDENFSLSLTAVGDTIFAGMPVVIIGGAADNTITATIVGGTDTEEAPINLANSLSGTYLPKAITADQSVYTLGSDGTQVGFYHWAGTIQNKAYFETTTTSSKGFAFDLSTITGIDKVVNDTPADSNAPRYNLAGQRVGKSYKGVVIVNGKKLIQK